MTPGSPTFRSRDDGGYDVTLRGDPVPAGRVVPRSLPGESRKLWYAIPAAGGSDGPFTSRGQAADWLALLASASRTYVLVIDTDRYSGNFERPMAAYCTGQCLKGDHGSEEAALFRKEAPPEMRVAFDRMVRRRPDSNGHMRPVAIWPTPGRVNDGRGNHFDAEGFQGTPHPAYESVAVFLSERPSSEVLAFVSDRARAYASVHRSPWPEPPIVVKGVRLLVEETTYREVAP